MLNRVTMLTWIKQGQRHPCECCVSDQQAVTAVTVPDAGVNIGLDVVLRDDEQTTKSLSTSGSDVVRGDD